MTVKPPKPTAVGSSKTASPPQVGDTAGMPTKPRGAALKRGEGRWGDRIFVDRDAAGATIIGAIG